MGRRVTVGLAILVVATAAWIALAAERLAGARIRWAKKWMRTA